MKLNDILHSGLITYLTEAVLNTKTSLESFKGLMGLKKFGFNPAQSGLDNKKTIDDRYETMMFALMIAHSKNLNRDIYNYISKKYDLKGMNWKSSNTTLSQYIFITLKNGIKLEIRVSDHSKPLGLNTSIYVLNVYYYTLLSDKLKEKIDNFIQKFNNIKS